jgi:RIO-like serine/threonine protein kinase
MRALGRDDPPLTFFLDGACWRRTRVVKHDFWAATAFYESTETRGRRAVAKINRLEPFWGIGLSWIGRFLCRREVRFYAALRDVPNVPGLLGRIGETGFVHAYVEGRPLQRDLPVPDRFFDALFALFAEVHRRGVAYVDANKPQNIIVGDDGQPHLIDFQISYDLHELGNTALNRALLKRFQDADIYHLLKHKRRLRPDQLTPEEQARSQRRGWLTRIHRFIGKPYFFVRRRVMRRLRESGQLLPEGSK